MASISKLNSAILSMPNELTVAAANFNIDFSLMKVEAPKEFHGLRDALSTHRRSAAEEGPPHITARRLGALFENMVPPIPHLIQTYGKRVSEISSRSTEAQNSPNVGIFSAQAGLDGTNIWAAATSGHGALAVHLLACMLARIWKSHEAISLWAELVERRKQAINEAFNNTNTAETAAIMAAQQTFTRQQLANWDSSARSWLQTADADRRLQQTQLMLIINNVRLPVNSKSDPYESVVLAWISAMRAMENLVQGIPQQVQNGAALLAMSSWHLYPNMEVLMGEIKDIDQHDELMNDALVTISVHGTRSDKEGVFWSLPLARMRYYSPPVVTERHIASETSRVSMGEFWIVVLGAIISQWTSSFSDAEKCCNLIILISDRISSCSNPIMWLNLLASAAKRYTSASGIEQRQFVKLFGLGMRWCKSLLNEPDKNPLAFFGLCALPTLLSMVSDVECKIAMLRRIAVTLQVNHDDVIIRYLEREPTNDGHEPTRTEYHYASAIASPVISFKTPQSHSEQNAMPQRTCVSLRHCRWIQAMLPESEISCGGSPCGYTSSECPESICDNLTRRCNKCCHGNSDQFQSSKESLPPDCTKDCLAEKECAACFNRIQQLKIETSGEQCFFFRHNDTTNIGGRRFNLAKLGEKETSYDFLLGDINEIAIFKKSLCRGPFSYFYRNGVLVTIQEILDALESIEPQKLHSYLQNWGSSGPEWFAISATQQRISMMALVFASSLYDSLGGATICIETIKRPLYEAKWALSTTSSEGHVEMSLPFMDLPLVSILSSLGSLEEISSQELDADIEIHLARCFACIAMFESGDCNIDLEVLRGVMALSSGDSIYVASALLSDPSKDTSKHPVQRVLGNLGRSELALLLPPSNPVLKDYDVNSWQMINHLPFDGTLGDNFASTSLHLSFTDFEMPVDVGARGLRDTLVILVETLVSINDGGKPLGDLEIISKFKNRSLTVKRECLHQAEQSIAGQAESINCQYKELVSIDCWDEIFDPPSSTGIVRAYGNWQARLAAAAASIQQGKKTLILPHKPCLQCIGEYSESSDFDFIIA